MTNPIEQAHAALVARLGEILPENGYATDVGTRIREGWLEDLLNDQETAFPFLAIQPAPYPPPLDGGGAIRATVMRRIVGVVDPGHPDNYRQLLDALYVDLAKALITPEGQPNPWGRAGPYRVVLGDAQQFPPGNGLSAGTLLFPVQLHVIIEGDHQA